ncbi:MAG TPA: PIN domain-containing protein [Terracidiphilus sp.]
MVAPVFILDSSALIRFFDNEPGAERVQQVLAACADGVAKVRVSAVQWGEITGNLRKRFGAQEQERVLGGGLPSELQIVAATAERAVRAAALRVDRGLGYADAFAVELAESIPQSTLLTADYGFKSAEDLIRIEFLPSK